MARPVKLGLDYFPTDTDILKNIKIRKLIRKYRELGFVLYLQLLTDIYRNSYFIELSDEYIFDLADQFHKRDKTILEMIDFMVEVDLFNKNLRNILILTSPSIQKRYFTVKGNSYKGLEKDLLYILIPLSTEKPPVISEEMPQSKVKERKGKESKENESINLIERESNARARENDQSLKAEWDQWKMELLNDEDWCATLIRISGKGLSLLDKTYQAMNCFDDINVLRALQNTVQTKKEYQSGFIAWWRHNNWETDMQVLSGAKSAKNKVPPRTEYKKPAARKSRYEEMMEVAAEAKLLTKKMYENNGFGYTIENSLEATTDYTA